MKNPKDSKQHIDTQNCSDDSITLPEYNPSKKCPRCGIELPIWCIRKRVLDGKPYLAHNFCPASDENKIIDLCIKCKMTPRPGSIWSVDEPVH